jgi:hypothetical protein
VIFPVKQLRFFNVGVQKAGLDGGCRSSAALLADFISVLNQIFLFLDISIVSKQNIISQ